MQASSAPLPINGSAPAAVPEPLTPAPQPQDAAPKGAPDTPAAPLEESPSGLAAGPATPGRSAPGTGSTPEDRTALATGSAGPTDGDAVAGTVTAYYVLLDDGGRNGVRFGCNDSLVGIARARSAEGALPAAIGALLGTAHANCGDGRRRYQGRNLREWPKPGGGVETRLGAAGLPAGPRSKCLADIQLLLFRQQSTVSC